MKEGFYENKNLNQYRYNKFYFENINKYNF